MQTEMLKMKAHIAETNITNVVCSTHIDKSLYPQLLHFLHSHLNLQVLTDKYECFVDVFSDPESSSRRKQCKGTEVRSPNLQLVFYHYIQG